MTMDVLAEETQRFVDDHRIARLATASSKAEPHVIPLCYARIDGRIYFVIDEKPKKTRTGLKRMQNICANPQVALVIDDYDEDWKQLAYLLLQGTAMIVEDEAEYRQALKQLRLRYLQYVAMPIEFNTNPMVRIDVRQAKLWKSATA